MIITSNASMVAAAFVSEAAAADGRVHRTVVMYGALLQTRVKANASGRPGPRVITGDYRRSIHRRTTRNAGGSVSEVGTNEPQGRRLEFGFTGVDRLGRYYDQPPYPHFGPALDAIRDDFIEALGNAAVGGDDR